MCSVYFQQTFQINVQALEQQLEEKHKKKEEEHFINEKYGERLKNCDKLILILDEEAKNVRNFYTILV